MLEEPLPALAFGPLCPDPLPFDDAFGPFAFEPFALFEPESGADPFALEPFEPFVFEPFELEPSEFELLEFELFPFEPFAFEPSALEPFALDEFELELEPMPAFALLDAFDPLIPEPPDEPDMPWAPPPPFAADPLAPDASPEPPPFVFEPCPLGPAVYEPFGRAPASPSAPDVHAARTIAPYATINTTAPTAIAAR